MKISPSFVLVLVSSFAFLNVQAKEWLSIFPHTIKNREGTSSSTDVILLQSRDMLGTGDDSLTAIKFSPGTNILFSKFLFKVPSSVNSGNVSTLRFVANVKAPAPESNVFKFQIRNVKKKKWEWLQSNYKKNNDQWNIWKKGKPNVNMNNFINKWGSVVVRLVSTTNSESIDIDFLKMSLAIENNALPIRASFTYDLPSSQSSYETDVVFIDLFDTTSDTIARLKSEGRVGICYFSAGSKEDWRDDASEFPLGAVGNALDGWEGEYWVDTTDDTVRSIMVQRIELAQKKGCQGVDPDNVDINIQTKPGFDLSTDDAVDYLQFLADESHSRNMLIGLKNSPEMASVDYSNIVSKYMDFAVVEECYHYEECDMYSTFISNGKPVFAIEYEESVDLDVSKCDEFESWKYSIVWSNLNLTEFQWCPN
mmetsp:Transcript_28160/g.41782  ORF Transcript_28160/g.41782 Transcript_28160/m.41782 type:complete len:423 (+) Transcript_28160:174-1442(+)